MKANKSDFSVPEIVHVLEEFSNFRRVLLMVDGQRVQAMQSRRKSWNSKLAKLADPKVVKMVFDTEGLLMLIPINHATSLEETGAEEKHDLEKTVHRNGIQIEEVSAERDETAVTFEDESKELSGIHEMFASISELDNLEDALIPEFLRPTPIAEEPPLNIRWKVIIPVAIICLTAPGIIVGIF
ncbi:MAG: hypothetical protein KF916_03580 [Microbacteriaceae bacterium]|nr:hypothetical protein [Microbacteriaceae bacterium]